ncbi:alkaline phosphatase family protein [Streptomyces sp. NPDC056669]|uniref:alkaline phosphatase family protein n=1 Tax=Streptomyces sp. NPDC056669 TaxID=3345903 RepID=UPI0036A0686A
MPHTAPPKAVVLGIDGGSLDLIEPLVAEGALPVLGRLLADSAHGPTTTTWPAHTAPGWSTFVTARRPGGHGIYQFFDTQDPVYGDRLVGTGDYGCDTAWEWFARQGWSVGLVNVPMSHPPRQVPGYQLTWPLARTLRYSEPPGLLGELARAGAGFKADIAAMFRGDLSYAEAAVEHVRARGRTIQYVLRERPVDVFMAVITEIDRICHHYWHFADACHDRHTLPDRQEWADAIRATYVAIDEVFGEILDVVGDETPVMLLSDHGFGPGRYNVAVNAVLAEAGLLATRPAATPPAAGDGLADWFRADGREVDFTRTRAYMPTPGCYAVNVNLAGRQRDGVVTDPGPVLAEAAELLLGLRAPDTGEPVFAAALPRADAYPGPMTHAAPDLLLIPADEGVLASPAISGPLWRPSEQTGMHRYLGMWALRGTSLAPGRRTAPVALADLMPTLLAEAGLTFPAAVHGRPLQWDGRDGADGGRAFLAPGETASAVASGGAEETARLSEEDLTAKALGAMGYL